MFFNCCRRNCCCRQHNRPENDYCDKKSNYDKCDSQKHDKCDYDKQEKCCCHINFEKKCYWENDKEDKFDKCSNNDSNNHNYSNYDSHNYYNEYNQLGYFNHYSNCDCDNESNRKSYQTEENYRNNDFNKNCYTPNWDSDRDCKCEKENQDKCDKHEWKCCKPVKYICIPFDKY